MRLTEIKKNLFDVRADFYAHCISADFGMGKGIALEFNKRFNQKNRLIQGCGSAVKASWGSDKPVRCVVDGKTHVINLITKENYWDKPTYETLEASLQEMKRLVPGPALIAMPRIGCGLDKLTWSRVKDIIIETFKDTNVDIIVCSLS